MIYYLVHFGIGLQWAGLEGHLCGHQPNIFAVKHHILSAGLKWQVSIQF